MFNLWLDSESSQLQWPCARLDLSSRQGPATTVPYTRFRNLDSDTTVTPVQASGTSALTFVRGGPCGSMLVRGPLGARTETDSHRSSTGVPADSRAEHRLGKG